MVKIRIDDEKCIGCGACVSACPVTIYSLENNKSKATGDKDSCIMCRACEASCPNGAIKIIE